MKYISAEFIKEDMKKEWKFKHGKDKKGIFVIKDTKKRKYYGEQFHGLMVRHLTGIVKRKLKNWNNNKVVIACPARWTSLKKELFIDAGKYIVFSARIYKLFIYFPYGKKKKFLSSERGRN